MLQLQDEVQKLKAQLGLDLLLLIETHPSVDLSKLVNNIKTVTSRKLRLEFSLHLKKFYWAEKPQFWSGSYAIISVGAQAPLDKLIEYVHNQEKPE